jgi:hypothetical protein
LTFSMMYSRFSPKYLCPYMKYVAMFVQYLSGVPFRLF